MYKNYIFDLYGTLVDIHANEDKPYLWQKIAMFYSFYDAEYTGREFAAEYKRLCHEFWHDAKNFPGIDVVDEREINLAEVFRRLFTDKGVDAGDELVAAAARMFRVVAVQKLRLFDDAKDTLVRLRESGCGVYLLTNAQRCFTAPELDYLGITEDFDGIVISSDIGAKKPNERMFRYIMEKYGLSASESVMVGNDDVADIRGAANVGLKGIYINTEQSPKLSGKLPKGSRVIQSLSEILI